MSRARPRSKPRSRAATAPAAAVAPSAPAPATAPVAAPTASVPGFAPRSFSPWWGTQRSTTRKPLFTFQADPAYQLTPSARTDLDVHAQTLAANTGLAAALKPLARIVGSLRPQARTGDPAYNALLEAAFQRVAGSPLIFDAAGVHDFYQYQTDITETRLIRGELFSVFTETTEGAARIASRGAHTVGGRTEDPGTSTGLEDPWYDGIRSDSNGFPLAYHFPGTRGKPGIVLDSRQVYHHANRHALGARRGVTALAPAINNIRDIVEITGNLKTAIKAASAVGITRRQDTPHGLPPSALGLAGPISADPFAAPDSLAASTTDLPAAPPLAFEDFVSSGIFSQVPLDVLHDDRPHPNIMAFKADLMRDIAAGIGVPHQLLFFMDDPGGAWSRILLEALVKFIVDQYNNHLRPFCQRFWVYAIAKEIKAGRLPPPPRGMTPQQMWNVRWCPPRNITADIARIGRLSIELKAAFMTTFASYYEELGMDWEEELTQCAQEIAYCRNLEATTPGLQPGDLTGWLPAKNGTAPTPTAEATVQQFRALLQEFQKPS